MPVELSVELDDEDWARLGTQLRQPEVPGAALAVEHDELWHGAKKVLRSAGQMDGPQLLAELAALSGSDQAGKRLLVRLRHSAEVRVDSGAQAPIYRWVG
jgi:hypothetical protein